MATAKVWVLKKAYEGQPTKDNFELTEEKLPPLKQDEILLEAVFLTVDPYFRLVPASEGLVGEQVARVVESQAKGFPKDSLVLAYVGWRSRTVINVNAELRMGQKIQLIEQVPGLSPSLWLGTLGMPGFTAYFSFIDRCEPQPGEIIVITAASGAVGNVVGQLAKEKGLTVIGLAGSREKCDYVKSLGFDYTIDYKTEDVSKALDRVAPDGVDIYYDNVGGDISDIVYGKLRANGRVLICGQISQYNTGFNKATNWNFQILRKELTIRGFQVYNPRYKERFAEARQELIQLIQQGKLKTKEHITEGFENMPQAFIDLFTGANFGKAIVKA